ncbi:MAG: disulfide bond formation protein B [Rhizobiaceae bacterium]|nr:disulfide bond formation protein B [Rhizobiaceae bacterium]
MTTVATHAAGLPAHRQRDAALFALVAMVATVGGALALQHLGGYIPCKLCLEQRTPYYIGIPLMALAFLSASFRLPAVIARVLLLAGGLLMAWGFYLGVYHAGVEWAWWPGPTDCGAVSGSVDTGGKGVLDALNAVVPPSCDQAALRIFGLSLAGWNAIATLVIGGVAFWGAAQKA